MFEDTHEPIVDGELWEQAHRRLKHATRRIKEGTHQEECLLPGLVEVKLRLTLYCISMK